MSNVKQYQQHHLKEKLIKIKSIEPKKIEQPNTVHSLPLQDEKNIIEEELQIARAELEQVKKEKENLLQSTIQEISNERENWKQEKEVLVKQGYQEGYDIGLVEGKQAAQEQYDDLMDQVNDLVHIAQKDYHATLEKSEHMIIDLAIATSEKIIKQKIAEDSEVFLEIVTAAIEEIKDQSVISIHLHPSNYELIMKQKSELSNSLDGDTKLSVYVDQKMIENKCLIEHPFGQIDASVDTQLEQIRDILHQIMMEKRS